MQAIPRNKRFHDASRCSVCLCSDRRLSVLLEFRETYKLLCKKIAQVRNSSELYLCWECMALLRNVKQFQEKVQESQELMKNGTKSDEKKFLRCLTRLSIAAPTILVSISADLDKMVQIKPELLVDIEVKQEKADFFNVECNEPLVSTKEDIPPEICISLEKVKKSESPELINEDKNDMSDNDSHEIENIYCKIEKGISEETVDSKPKKKRGRPPKNKGTPETEGPTKKQFKMSIERSKLYKFVGGIKASKANLYTSRRIPFHEVPYWIEFEKNSDFYKKTKNKYTKVRPEDSETHVGRNLRHSCELCGKSFELKKKLSVHMRKHSFLRRCNSCEYQCLDKHHMYSHARRHGPLATRAVECLECHDTFNNTRIFYEHYRTTHYAMKHFYYCHHCSKKCLSKKMIERHITRRHMPQVCTACNMTFSSFGKLVGHNKLRHRVERTEESYCAPCDRQFDNVALYKAHLSYAKAHAAERKPVPKKSYQCPACLKVYSKRTTMTNHFNQFHSEKPRFYCAECDKAFLTNVHLRNHRNYRHLGYERKRNKMCTICGRGFTKNSVLINHMRTHTGERPYGCPHCDARFTQRIAMQTHVKNIHSKRV